MRQINDVYSWVKGCVEWMEELDAFGWRPYYVNIMFRPLPGSVQSVISQMHTKITEGFYEPFAEWVEKKSAISGGSRHYLPKLMLFPDKPVCKKRKEVRDRSFGGNHDGFHFNGSLMMPPKSYFKKSVVEHIKNKQSRYTKNGISRIHIKRVKEIPNIVDYSVKTIKRRNADTDQILILPPSASELPVDFQFDPPGDRKLKEVINALNVSEELAMQLLADPEFLECFDRARFNNGHTLRSNWRV